MSLSLGIICYVATVTGTVGNSHKQFLCEGEEETRGRGWPKEGKSRTAGLCFASLRWKQSEYVLQLRGKKYPCEETWMTSLVVSDLRLHALNAGGAQVQFLVRELDPTGHNEDWRSYMLLLRPSTAKQIFFKKETWIFKWNRTSPWVSFSVDWVWSLPGN